MKLKRLKIVEQIIIVVLFSLIIPLIVTGVIVNNINRQALARELGSAAKILAETVDNNIFTMFAADDAQLKNIALAVKHIENRKAVNAYLADFCKNSSIFSELKVETYKNKDIPEYIKNNISLDNKYGNIVISENIKDDNYLVGTIRKSNFETQVFKNINEQIRQIYVLTPNGQLLFSLNYDARDYNNLLTMLPTSINSGDANYFGNIENQPMVYRKMLSADLLILVNTTAEITEKTIYTSAWKIFTAMFVSTIVSIFIVILYIYYLYINIRQLFRGIIALSEGNYSRKIRLIKSIFTPSELVFFAQEFNKMADEINVSYSQLDQRNKELLRLDNFRSNLVDTVSHEFRTPLTSIKGYTSRLMRKDIDIDEATLHKSLKIIKQQCERLSRMVEDLLVIPDIEGARLNINPESVNVSEIIDSSLLSVKNIEKRQIINRSISVNVSADRDRFEQVLINLFENACKYSYDDTAIEIDVINVKGKVTISIKNQSDFIEKPMLKRLFEKFTRIDDKTTRTTRGTGLGLFIVKGIVQAMNGSIYLKSTEDNVFTVYLVLPEAK